MTTLTPVTPAVFSLDHFFHYQIYMSDLPPDISTWMEVGHFIFARFIDDINTPFVNVLISLSS